MAMWAGALSWCRNQSPLCHFSGRFRRRLSHTIVSTQSSKTPDLLFVLEEQTACALSHQHQKKESLLFWHLSKLAMLCLVWANLVTSTDVTAALTQDCSSSSNSHHLLKLLWETENHFWALLANHSTFTCLFFCSCVGIWGTNFAATHLIMKCVDMNFNTHLFFHKFCSWSSDDL